MEKKGEGTNPEAAENYCTRVIDQFRKSEHTSCI